MSDINTWYLFFYETYICFKLFGISIFPTIVFIAWSGFVYAVNLRLHWYRNHFLYLNKDLVLFFNRYFLPVTNLTEIIKILKLGLIVFQYFLYFTIILGFWLLYKYGCDYYIVFPASLITFRARNKFDEFENNFRDILSNIIQSYHPGRVHEVRAKKGSKNATSKQPSRRAKNVKRWGLRSKLRTRYSKVTYRDARLKRHQKYRTIKSIRTRESFKLKYSWSEPFFFYKRADLEKSIRDFLKYEGQHVSLYRKKAPNDWTYRLKMYVKREWFFHYYGQMFRRMWKRPLLRRLKVSHWRFMQWPGAGFENKRIEFDKENFYWVDFKFQWWNDPRKKWRYYSYMNKEARLYRYLKRKRNKYRRRRSRFVFKDPQYAYPGWWFKKGRIKSHIRNYRSKLFQGIKLNERNFMFSGLNYFRFMPILDDSSSNTDVYGYLRSNRREINNYWDNLYWGGYGVTNSNRRPRPRGLFKERFLFSPDRVNPSFANKRKFYPRRSLFKRKNYRLRNGTQSSRTSYTTFHHLKKYINTVPYSFFFRKSSFNRFPAKTHSRKEIVGLILLPNELKTKEGKRRFLRVSKLKDRYVIPVYRRPYERRKLAQLFRFSPGPLPSIQKIFVDNITNPINTNESTLRWLRVSQDDPIVSRSRMPRLRIPDREEWPEFFKGMIGYALFYERIARNTMLDAHFPFKPTGPRRRLMMGDINHLFRRTYFFKRELPVYKSEHAIDMGLTRLLRRGFVHSEFESAHRVSYYAAKYPDIPRYKFKENWEWEPTFRNPHFVRYYELYKSLGYHPTQSGGYYANDAGIPIYMQLVYYMGDAVSRWSTFHAKRRKGEEALVLNTDLYAPSYMDIWHTTALSDFRPYLFVARRPGNWDRGMYQYWNRYQWFRWKKYYYLYYKFFGTDYYSKDTLVQDYLDYYWDLDKVYAHRRRGLSTDFDRPTIEPTRYTSYRRLTKKFFGNLKVIFPSPGHKYRSGKRVYRVSFPPYRQFNFPNTGHIFQKKGYSWGINKEGYYLSRFSTRDKNDLFYQRAHNKKFKTRFTYYPFWFNPEGYSPLSLDFQNFNRNTPPEYAGFYLKPYLNTLFSFVNRFRLALPFYRQILVQKIWSPSPGLHSVDIQNKFDDYFYFIYQNKRPEFRHFNYSMWYYRTDPRISQDDSWFLREAGLWTNTHKRRHLRNFNYIRSRGRYKFGESPDDMSSTFNVPGYSRVLVWNRPEIKDFEYNFMLGSNWYYGQGIVRTDWESRKAHLSKKFPFKRRFLYQRSTRGQMAGLFNVYELKPLEQLIIERSRNRDMHYNPASRAFVSVYPFSRYRNYKTFRRRAIDFSFGSENPTYRIFSGFSGFIPFDYFFNEGFLNFKFKNPLDDYKDEVNYKYSDFGNDLHDNDESGYTSFVKHASDQLNDVRNLTLMAMGYPPVIYNINEKEKVFFANLPSMDAQSRMKRKRLWYKKQELSDLKKIDDYNKRRLSVINTGFYPFNEFNFFFKYFGNFPEKRNFKEVPNDIKFNLPYNPDFRLFNLLNSDTTLLTKYLQQFKIGQIEQQFSSGYLSRDLLNKFINYNQRRSIIRSANSSQPRKFGKVIAPSVYQFCYDYYTLSSIQNFLNHKNLDFYSLKFHKGSLTGSPELDEKLVLIKYLNSFLANNRFMNYFLFYFLPFYDLLKLSVFDYFNFLKELVDDWSITLLNFFPVNSKNFIIGFFYSFLFVLSFFKSYFFLILIIVVAFKILRRRFVASSYNYQPFFVRLYRYFRSRFD